MTGRTFSRFTIAVLVTAIASAGVSAPAHASPVRAAGSSAVNQGSFMSAVRKLQPYVARNADGTFAVRASAEQAGVADNVYKRVLAGVNRVNGEIVAGQLRTTPDLDVYAASGHAVFTVQNGINAFVQNWWGDQVFLDRGNTDRLISLLKGGTAIGAFLAAIGLPEAGIVAALAAIGWWALTTCETGNGVWVAWVGGSFPWCGGQ